MDPIITFVAGAVATVVGAVVGHIARGRAGVPAAQAELVATLQGTVNAYRDQQSVLRDELRQEREARASVERDLVKSEARADLLEKRVSELESAIARLIVPAAPATTTTRQTTVTRTEVPAA